MKIFVKCKLKTLLLRVDIAGKLDKAFGSLDAPDDWLLTEDSLQGPKYKQSILKKHILRLSNPFLAKIHQNCSSSNLGPKFKCGKLRKDSLDLGYCIYYLSKAFTEECDVIRRVRHFHGKEEDMLCNFWNSSLMR